MTATPTPPGGALTLPQPCVYVLHGLRVRSEMSIAGVTMNTSDYDVDVTWGPEGGVPDEPPPGRIVIAQVIGDGYRYVGACDGSTLALRVPGVCDFVIGVDLRTVECRPDPRIDPAMVSVLVAGLVVAFLLSMAGEVVLHASAVEIGGRAVAFAGASGSGKSTLATLLCAAGAGLVTDDVLRLATTAGSVRCIGGTPQLRLRTGARWALDDFASPPPSFPTPDGRLAVMPAPNDHPAVPLSTVVLPLLSREATDLRFRPLARADAALHLLSLGRVVGWKSPSVLARQFHATGRIAAAVAVVEAVIPWKSESPSAIVGPLADLARAPGSNG